jgi:hypothetical protein
MSADVDEAMPDVATAAPPISVELLRSLALRINPFIATARRWR